MRLLSLPVGIGRTAVLILAGILVAGTLVTALVLTNTSPSRVPACNAKEAALHGMRSVGYVAYWDQERGLAALAAADGAVNEVSPSWYSLLPRGDIILQDEGRVDDSPAVVARIRERDALVVPVIANYRDGEWDSQVVDKMLSDRSATRRHVDAIVNLARSRGFDGVDVDYEYLNADTRQSFSEFIAQLAGELHERGKLLSVTLHPKTSEPGPQGKNQAQDYAAIGRVADEVRIMLYDYHWDTSEPGPIAPMAWVRTVMRFAVTQIPSHKVILGLGTYGYDWVGDRGESLTWQDIRDLGRAHNGDVHWDDVEKSPWFTYKDDSGLEHHVWFENAQSLRAKRGLAHELCLGGVHYWRLGGNDPSIWRPAR